MSPRDSQRSKVYAAERRAFDAESFDPANAPTIEAAEALVRKVEATALWAKLCDRGGTVRRTWRPVVVEVGRGGGYAFGTRLISLGRYGRQDWVVIHELAHIAVARRHGIDTVAAHGWEFCDTYLKLVRRFLGQEAHDRLKAEYKAGKVRIRPKATRTLTDEQRQVLRDRLATIREAS